ncbi:hypothetical protein HY639_00280 [Candidatus Woesearchaeota archaeon]|nr:hypothetical protein [Candidatus Woesearchaeota archaeon]
MRFERRSVFLHAFFYDALFYFGFGLLMLVYQAYVVDAVLQGSFFGAALATLLLLGAALVLWVWTTSLLFSEVGKQKTTFAFFAGRSSLLVIAITLLMALLLSAGSTAVTRLVPFLVANASLAVSSLTLAFLVVGIMIPLAVTLLVALHVQCIAWFYQQRIQHVLQRLGWCIVCFTSVSILSLGLTSVSEVTELVLSGLLLMTYFAWQKAYLLTP